MDTSKNILVFDTETTGFINDRLPLDHEDQPHVVQLAAMLLESTGRVISSFNFIVNPGVPVPEPAAKVHGITTDISRAYGVRPSTAFGALGLLAHRAGLLVAHNIRFDKQVCAVGVARRLADERLLTMPTFCTMDAAAPVVNLPPTERMRAAGRNGPKAPSLTECVRHFFGETLDGAHDAMVDVDGCRRVYFHLQKLKAAA